MFLALVLNLYEVIAMDAKVRRYNDYITATKAQHSTFNVFSSSTDERTQQRPSVRSAVSRNSVYQCTILSFTRNKVVDFVLLPTTNRNDTREDKQRDNNAYMKTQHSNITRERRRKGTELRALWTAGVAHLRAGIGS